MLNIFINIMIHSDKRQNKVMSKAESIISKHIVNQYPFIIEEKIFQKT